MSFFDNDSPLAIGGELSNPIQCVIGKNGSKCYPLICMDCDKQLAELYTKENNQVEREYTANCPYCNGKTFKKKFVGSYIIIPTNTIILDLSDTDTSTHFTLGVQK